MINRSSLYMDIMCPIKDYTKGTRVVLVFGRDTDVMHIRK